MHTTLMSLRPEAREAIAAFHGAIRQAVRLQPRHYELATIAATVQLGCSA